MDIEAYRDHWLLGEFFREPAGGRRGWALLGLAVLFVIWGVAESAWPLSLFVIPFAAAEVLPEDRISAAAALRGIGTLYMLVVPVGFLVLS